jgi:hypothetical protein
VRRRRQRAAELVVEDRRLEQRLAAAAVGLRDQDPDEALLRELLPETVGIAAGVVLEGAHDVDRGVLRAEGAHHVAQNAVLFGEVEIHALMLPLLIDRCDSRRSPHAADAPFRASSRRP